ncbi:MAG: hypothetical protein IPK56_11025 [Elusimicrobia bacterium]|nr:hypothetical protein [Elusimicrobiota bacterium]
MSWTRAWALALLGFPRCCSCSPWRLSGGKAASPRLWGPLGVMARLHDPFTGRLQRVKALLSFARYVLS